MSDPSASASSSAAAAAAGSQPSQSIAAGAGATKGGGRQQQQQQGSFNQFIQNISQTPASTDQPPITSDQPQYRRAQRPAWASSPPPSSAPRSSFGSPSPVRSLADYTPDVPSLLAGRQSSPTVALTSPWLWNRRPVDTRHLPVPRPLPPVYSDLRRMRAPPLDLREPWQRWLQVGTLTACGSLALYTALYLPIDEDDLMHGLRRWWFGAGYQSSQRGNTPQSRPDT